MIEGLYVIYIILIISPFVRFFLSPHLTSIFLGFIAFFLGYNRSLGPDTMAYMKMFNDYSYSIKIFQTGNLEFLWLYFVWLLDSIGLGHKMGFAITAFLSIYIRTLAINIFFGKSKYLSVLGMITFISNDLIIRDLGQIRNGLMSSFFVLFVALSFTNASKIKRLLTGAFTFFSHISGLAGIIFYYMSSKYFYKNFILVTILSGVFAIAAVEILYEITQLKVLDRLILYTSSENYLRTGSFPIFIFLSGFILFLSFIFFKHLSEKQKRLVRLYSFAPIIYLSFIQFPVISSRLSSILISLNCLLIPILINLIIAKFVSYQRIFVYVCSLYLLVFVGSYYFYSFINTYI